MSDKYLIPGTDGEPIGRLNATLAFRQSVTDEQLSALIMTHQLKEVIFAAARLSLNEPLKLKMLAAMFDALEFEQQTLWNFPRDANFHFFWNFPGCTCPKIDNNERWGTSHKIHALDCPVHGKLTPKPTPARSLDDNGIWAQVPKRP